MVKPERLNDRHRETQLIRDILYQAVKDGKNYLMSRGSGLTSYFLLAGGKNIKKLNAFSLF